MSIVQNIIYTYHKPQQVIVGLLEGVVSESRSLAILMGGCVSTFVSTWPALARQAHLESKDLTDLMGGALLAWVFIMPLVFYVLAMMLWGIQRVLLGRARMDQVRIVLFWSFFASLPFIFLHGLVRGFIGEGAAQKIVGFIWFAIIVWFVASGFNAIAKLGKSND
jgi:hypothetical protein